MDIYIYIYRERERGRERERSYMAIFKFESAHNRKEAQLVHLLHPVRRLSSMGKIYAASVHYLDYIS